MRIPNLIFSTIILFVSNLIARVLGFVYKIFLSRFIGEMGLGIYHIIFNFLMLSLAITTTGIPTSLSCLVARDNALKNKKNTSVLLISTLYITFFISLIISLIISFNSVFLSKMLLHNSNLNVFILAICPAIVIITISNVLRGYFYGIKKVIIPAFGQFLEQLSRILFFYIIAMYIKDDSINCYMALLAISLGEAISVIYMSMSLYKDNTFLIKHTISIKEVSRASLETLKLSVPITCNKMSSIIIQSVSSIMIPSRLILSGMTHSQALGIYGVISGMVMPFVLIPFTVGSALVVNLIPSISQEVALKRNKNIVKKIVYSILLTTIVGLLTSVFFYFYSDELCIFVFNNKLAGIYLKAMFLVPLFMSLNQTISSILHSIGKEFVSSLNNIVGMVIQLVSLYIFLPNPNLNIYAYIYTVTIVSIITFVLHTITLLDAMRKFK